MVTYLDDQGYNKREYITTIQKVDNAYKKIIPWQCKDDIFYEKNMLKTK